MVLDLQARYPSPSSGSLTVPFSCYPTSDVDCIVGLFFSSFSSTQCNLTNGTFGVTPRFSTIYKWNCLGQKMTVDITCAHLLFVANQHAMFQFSTMTLDFMIS